MADRTIGELPAAAEMNDDSLLVVEQQSQARSIRGGLVKKYAESALDRYVQGAGFLLDIGQTVTGEPGTAAAVENTGTAEKPVLRFTIPRGDAGEVSRAELDAALQRKPNPNLLDNWYFVGGGSQQGGGQFPINQRGKTKYMGNPVVYTFDRWTFNSEGAIHLDNDGIYFDEGVQGWAVQYIENVSYDRDYTASIFLSDNTCFYGTFKFPKKGEPAITMVRIPDFDKTLYAEYSTRINKSTLGMYAKTGNSAKIVAVKLELGSQQTLAHKEGGTWVLNEIPDYTTELAKCQRYLKHIDYAECFPVVMTGTDFLDFCVPVGTQMRSRPTLTGTWNVAGNHSGFTFSVVSGSASSGGVLDTSAYRVRATKTSHGIVKANAFLEALDNCFLNAEL